MRIQTISIGISMVKGKFLVLTDLQ